VFIDTLGPTFNFKAMDIDHHSCPPSYKCSNDPSKTIGLHFKIQIKIYMLVIMECMMVLSMELMTFLKHQQHIIIKSSIHIKKYLQFNLPTY
jgi:hypothetical protein